MVLENNIYHLFLEKFIPESSSLDDVKLASFLLLVSSRLMSNVISLGIGDISDISGIPSRLLVKSINFFEEKGFVKIINNNTRTKFITMEFLPERLIKTPCEVVILNYKDKNYPEKDQSKESKLYDQDHDLININKKDLIIDLVTIGIFESTAEELVTKWDESRIREKIELLKRLTKRGIKFNNQAGFLIKAIENDYPLYEKNKKVKEEKKTKEENTEMISGDVFNKKNSIEDSKESMTKTERTKLRHEAYNRLKEDLGGSYQKISEVALRAYENLIIEERQNKDEAVPLNKRKKLRERPHMNFNSASKKDNALN